MSFLDRILGRSRENASGLDPDRRSEEYRTADPRDLVETEGGLTAGPGGTPQDGLEEPEEQEEPGQ